MAFGLLIILSCNRIKKKAILSKENFSENVLSAIDSDTVSYNKYSFDIDNDGYIDKVYCNKHLLGDSLFVFRTVGQKYELSLKTINFSEDGIFVVKNIEKPFTGTTGLKISAYFNGSEGMTQDIYLYYNKISKEWKIDNTVFKTTFCDEKDNCFDKTCKVAQNIILDNKTNWSKYRNIDSAKKNECKIEKIR